MTDPINQEPQIRAILNLYKEDLLDAIFDKTLNDRRKEVEIATNLAIISIDNLIKEIRE